MRVFLVACIFISLSGCVSEPYSYNGSSDSTQNTATQSNVRELQYKVVLGELGQRRRQCVSDRGGSDPERLRTVPRSRIISGVECYIQADKEILIPFLTKWGYSTTSTYKKHESLLQLARKRAAGTLSADEYGALASNIEDMATSDLIDQDYAKQRQRAADAAIEGLKTSMNQNNTNIQRDWRCENQLYVQGLLGRVAQADLSAALEMDHINSICGWAPQVVVQQPYTTNCQETLNGFRCTTR